MSALSHFVVEDAAAMVAAAVDRRVLARAPALTVITPGVDLATFRRRPEPCVAQEVCMAWLSLNPHRSCVGEQGVCVVLRVSGSLGASRRRSRRASLLQQ